MRDKYDKNNQDETPATVSIEKTGSGFVERTKNKIIGWYNYLVDGVWNETRRSPRVDFIKMVSLSVRSFLNSDLQMRAGYLTYQTILAIVPALALLFAIGRGFGFQNLLQTQVFDNIPIDNKVLGTVLHFVDSYLAQSSEGIFVGIGILFLLWTMVSLISNVEDSFNKIWGLKQGRSFWRKITDYLAILLILPVMMISANGIMVMMGTTLQTMLPFGFLSPLLKVLLDFLSMALIWLFFTGSYMLIPNTKVKFKNAFVAGMMAGTAYLILQWLFVSGQLYVTRYNAIYGSFAFLPLLLIWLQLVWIITLSGGVICFSSQNIFEFSFSSDVGRISENYKWKLTLAVMTIAVDRFLDEKPPLTTHQMAVEFGLPITLINSAAHKLEQAGLLQRVMQGQPDDECGLAPAIEPSKITVGEVMERLGAIGSSNFIPDLDNKFSSLSEIVSVLRVDCLKIASKYHLSDVKINLMNGFTNSKDKK